MLVNCPQVLLAVAALMLVFEKPACSHSRCGVLLKRVWFGLGNKHISAKHASAHQRVNRKAWDRGLGSWEATCLVAVSCSDVYMPCAVIEECRCCCALVWWPVLGARGRSIPKVCIQGRLGPPCHAGVTAGLHHG